MNDLREGGSLEDLGVDER